MEIEKKFLLYALPEGLSDRTEIRQGYLSVGDPEVRIRSKGGRYFATRKGGEGFVRSEDEAEISAEVFGILWPATAGQRVEKVRYRLTGPDGLVWEVDQYSGHLAWLYTAEVELPSEDIRPVMPDAIAEVLVSDVTLDKRYKNKALAVAEQPLVL